MKSKLIALALSLSLFAAGCTMNTYKITLTSPAGVTKVYYERAPWQPIVSTNYIHGHYVPDGWMVEVELAAEAAR